MSIHILPKHYTDQIRALYITGTTPTSVAARLGLDVGLVKQNIKLLRIKKTTVDSAGMPIKPHYWRQMHYVPAAYRPAEITPSKTLYFDLSNYKTATI